MVKSPMIRYSFVLLMGIFFGRQWTLLNMEQHLQPTFAAGDVDDSPVVKKENTPVISTGSKVSSTEPAEMMQTTSQVTQTYNTTNHNATKRRRESHPQSYVIKKIVEISDFQAEIERRKPNWQREAAKEVLHEPVKIYDGVVHVTKVHSAGKKSINQMLCLNKAAYNHRRNYPWVIFHTMPIPEKDMAEAKAIAAPANVTFVRDSPPLEEVIANFSVEEQEYLIDRCQCCNPKNDKECCKDPSKNVYWDFWCYEEKTGWVTLSYAWQAVFRSYGIWSHRALADYKYMIWIDDDAIPTKSWLRDPIVPMVEEDLVIFYDNFPAGFCKSGGIIEKMQLAYNHSYCYIHRIHVFKGNQTGKFVVRPCKKNKHGKYILDKFGLVHGMMHITNLDVYRKPIHLNFNRLLTQHKTHPFSREWDDQIAVTVPAAFEDPERAWDMRMHGFNMSIHHNGKLDGKNKALRWRYTTWWKYHNDTFPVGREMCNHVITFGG